MNFLRRFAILLYGLALLALVSIILLFPDTVADGLRSLGDVDSTTRGAVAVIVGLVIVIALFLLVRAPRFSNTEGLIVKTPGALADVGIASARERILKAVLAVPNVVSTDVKLQAIQGKADIDLSVEVAGTNINVPNKQREIDRALRQVTLKQLGLQLASRPRVHIQLMTEEELRARDEASRRPLAPPVAAAPDTWTPAPAATPPPAYVPPPAPVAAAIPMPAPAQPESWAEPVESVQPPPAPMHQEPVSSDFVLTPAPEEENAEPDWLAGVTADDDLLVEEDSAEPAWLAQEVDAGFLAEEDSTEPDFFNEEPIAAELEPVSESDESEEDEDLKMSPVDFVIPSATPADDTLVLDMDESVVSATDTESEDWLSADSSDEAETGLYAEDRERRNHATGSQSPPLPDLD